MHVMCTTNECKFCDGMDCMNNEEDHIHIMDGRCASFKQKSENTDEPDEEDNKLFYVIGE